MPPKKRSKPTATRRRQSTRLRPSDLTETTAEAALKSAPPPPTAGTNTMTVDIQALTASISVAVSQAVKQALEQGQTATVPSPMEKTREVETVVEKEAASIAEGTRKRISSPPMSMPADKPFASIAVALGSRVSSKIKNKIWAKEYVDFGALLSISPNTDKYSLSLKPSTSASNQTQLTLEPVQPSKKIHSFNQWLSAFNTFVAIYSERFPNEAPKLMKYCEIIRDISIKPGDWSFYDEQFRYIRQSAPENYPWDNIHRELWLKAVINFRAKPQNNSDKFAAGASARVRPRQSFPKGSCWTFHASRYCSGCRFEHVCYKCGAKHPASQFSAGNQQRAALPRNGPIATNSTQQTGNTRKGGQA